MNKYIIEIPDDTRRIWIDVFGEGYCYTQAEGVDDLEELNSDYINEHFGELQDEAYQRGHDDGYEAGCATAFKPVSDAEYQRGLEDAWEAARKIVVDPNHGGIASGTLLEIFGMRGYSYIMQENTAQQAIDKIKAYEDKQKEKNSIEVGDEVIYNGVTKCVVVTPETDVRYASLFDCNGIHYSADHRECKKTGKHYDIQSILEAMRE